MNDKFLFPLTFEKPCEKKESQGVLDVIKSYTKSVSQKVKNIINPAISTVLLTSCAHVWDVSQNENDVYENISAKAAYSEVLSEENQYTINIKNVDNIENEGRVIKTGNNEFEIQLNNALIDHWIEANRLDSDIYKNHVLANELWGIFGDINIENLSRENIELLWDYFSLKYLSDVSWSSWSAIETWKILAKHLRMNDEATDYIQKGGKYHLSYNVLKQTFEESFVWVEMNQNTINDLYLQLMWYQPGSYEINGYKPSDYAYSTYDIEYFFTAFEQNVYNHFENEVGIEQAELLRTEKVDDLMDKYIQRDVILAKN